MHKQFKLAGVVGAAAIVAMAGCDDFLTGPGFTENPNQPVAATPTQLLVGVQARQFITQQGQLARLSAIWTQQIAGTNNQQMEWGSHYGVNENHISGHYNGIYVGGGLVDLRKIQEDSPDPRLQGIARVWEALTIGTATSIWGDLPYREAVNPEIDMPRLDPQEQIYADIQGVLDTAIDQLSAASSTPAFAPDLIYRGDTDRWVRAANTLKARYHLHTAVRLGGAAYEAALAAAQQGINEAPENAFQAMHNQAPGDFRSWHGSSLDNANIWSQFLEARSDMTANERMLEVLEERDDPRLAAYHDARTSGEFAGQFIGADRFGGGGGNASLINQEVRLDREFRQPMVSWAENQLIMAEAHFQLGRPDDARTHLNNVRTAVGLDPLTGLVTLEDIMTEKWIVQFQNVDAYTDYRRTCYPRLAPAGDPVADEIPPRVAYGQLERLNNVNVPSPSEQPRRNWAFPDACETL